MSDGRFDLDRRRLLGQSGPRRLGRDPSLRRPREGALRRRSPDHQQPHGADGRDRGARGAEPACAVDLHTDSQYLRGGVTGWIHNWKRNGWRTADKKPVKNDDLWRRLDEAATRHEIDWRWVKGHAGDAMNERADELARAGHGAVLVQNEGGANVSRAIVTDAPQGCWRRGGVVRGAHCYMMAAAARGWAPRGG